MGKNNRCSIDDLFDLFEDNVSSADILASKLMAQISTAISKERLRLGMNQTEFANYIGATQSLVSRWEHGDYNFTIQKISEIAAILNLDINISMSNIKSPNYTASFDRYDSGKAFFSETKYLKLKLNKYQPVVISTNKDKSYPAVCSKEVSKYASIC